jgi:glyoxylase-like metal-dependent hydrolase (beta-lactamase superfamily II)
VSQITTYEVGRRQVHVLNMGTLQFRLGDLVEVPKDETPGADAALLTDTVLIPCNTIIVECDGAHVVVDPFRPESVCGTPYEHPGYTPPAPLAECLDALGVCPDAVAHVALTHWHWDHLSGLVCSDESDAPFLFPQARHYLGRADWAEARQAFTRGGAQEYGWLTRLRQAGLLELVSGARDIVPGVRFLPAPGESPGHHIISVRSDGASALIIGDLFHHEIEVTHPTWMSAWNYPSENIASRRSVVEDALASDALIIPGHFGAGKFARSGNQVEWRRW